MGFKRHPLAPCVFPFYEHLGGNPECFAGLVVVETDDLLIGGIGDKFHAAVKQLREKFQFGKWVRLREQATEYGGRTLKQSDTHCFTISIVRYLEDRARAIDLPRGRAKNQTQMRLRQR